MLGCGGCSSEGQIVSSSWIVVVGPGGWRVVVVTVPGYCVVGVGVKQSGIASGKLAPMRHMAITTTESANVVP